MPHRSWTDRFRHLLAPHERVGASARAAREGLNLIAESRAQQQVELQGDILGTSTGPSGWLEAELSDGTGTVLLIWMGHRQLAAIQPRRTLRVQGRLALRGKRLVIYNPAYDVVA